jgi:phosphoglycerol transferase MdoB-like AlkP superfamily enzyme
MNIFGSNSQLSDVGHKLAIFLLVASLAIIPLVGIIGYIFSRALAAGEPENDEAGRRDGKRRFWFTAVLVPVVFAALYITLDPSLIARLYGTGRNSPTSNSQDVQVWASQRSGLYYCPGTKLYGKVQPGKQMPESTALQSGFQPSLRQVCR